MHRRMARAAGAARWIVVVALAGVASCYRFDPGAACHIQCSSGACPSGLTCNPNGLCGATGDDCMGVVADAPTVDAGAGADASPDAMPNNLRRYKELKAGAHHTCAIDADDQLWCWGWDGMGQVSGNYRDPADLTAVSQPLKISFAGQGTWRGLSAGRDFSCAILTPPADSDQLWCWGQSFHGEIGTSAYTAGHFQVGLMSVTEVAAGGNFACAISTADGPPALYCWGDDSRGQLGDGTSGSGHALPGVALTLTGYVPHPGSLTAGGAHACFLDDTTGFPVCWGDAGRLAAGAPANVCGSSLNCRNTPTLFAATAMTQIAAGDQFTCAIDMAASRLQCWGAADGGALGTTTSDSATPQMLGTTMYKALAVGWQAGCAIAMDDKVWCWGDQTSGQRANNNEYGPRMAVPTPSVVAGAHAVAVGEEFACGLVDDGRAVCWGHDQFGQLGNGLTETEWAPVPIPLPPGAVGKWLAVSAGNDFTCGVVGPGPKGDLYCWGRNDTLQAGDEVGHVDLLQPRAVEYQLMPVTAIERLTSGGSHSCASGGANNEEIYCWGADDAHQLGDNQTVPKIVSTQTLNPVHGLIAGAQQTCAQQGTDTWRCWGTGAYDDGVGNYGSPTAQMDLMPFTEIVIGPKTMCARAPLADQRPGQCRGTNDVGQLGDGSTTPSDFMVNIATPTGSDLFDSIDVAHPAFAQGTSDHACGLVKRGATHKLLCWGSNGYGQTSSADTDVNTLQPVEVLLNGVTSWRAAAVGAEFTCAAAVSGDLACWGHGDRGQLAQHLGPSSPDSTNTPQRVLSISHVDKLTAGAFHACAIDDDGALFCWGSNAHGAVGNGGGPQPLPVNVID